LQLASMSPDEQQESKQLALMLAMVLTGTALTCVMNGPSKNGYEQWRILARREDPTSGLSQVALLQKITKYPFSGEMAKYMQELEAFEALVKVYENSSGEVYSDAQSQALAKAGAPTEIRGSMMTTAYKSFQELKDVVASLVPDADESATPADGMEVDALTPQKQKWWEKRKNDHKGKGKGSFGGSCWHCKQPGHVQRECPQWKRDQQWSSSSWHGWQDWGSSNMISGGQAESGESHAVVEDATHGDENWIF